MKNDAFLIEVFDKENTLVKRRISMNCSNAMDWIEQFATKHDAIVQETFSDSGTIINDVDFWDYKLTNIALV